MGINNTYHIIWKYNIFIYQKCQIYEEIFYI